MDEETARDLVRERRVWVTAKGVASLSPEEGEKARRLVGEYRSRLGLRETLGLDPKLIETFSGWWSDEAAG